MSSGVSSSSEFKAFILGSLGLIGAITGEELMGYQMLPGMGAGLPSLDSYLILCIFQALFALAFFLYPTRIGSVLQRPKLQAASLALAVLGCAAIVAGDFFGLPPWGSLAGFFLLSAGAFLLKIMNLELLASLSLRWSKRILFAAIMVQSLFAPIFLVRGAFAWPAALAALIVGGIFTRAAKKSFGSRYEDVTRERFKTKTSLTLGVFAGFGIICLCIAFLNPLSLYGSLSSTEFVAMVFLTHFCAALLFGLFVFVFQDASYAFAFRTIDSLILIAFTLLALLGSASLFPRAMCTTVLSLFEFATFLAIADLASHSSMHPLKLFGAYYVIMRGLTVGGILLGFADGTAAIGAPFALIGVLLSVLMTFAALWLMAEKNLNLFFWGHALLENQHTGSGTEQDLLTILEGRVIAIADACGLSPREHDVLKLIAAGRSSTFIAEQLFLSNNTVRKHIAHIYSKCGVHSKQELLTLVQYPETLH